MIGFDILASSYVDTDTPDPAVGPTRFYLEAAGAPQQADISPAYDAAWGNTVLASAFRFHPAKVLTTLGNYAGNASTTTVNGVNTLHRQYISRPLVAQTIAGTVKGIIRGAESVSGGDYKTQLVIRVVSNDGSTVRGVLLAADAGGLTNELATSHLTRKIPAGWVDPGTVLSPVDVQDGDRLVVEVGVKKYSATSSWVTMLFGSNGASDFLETEGQSTLLNPWIEFSSAIDFEPVTSRPTLISATFTQIVPTSFTVDVPIPATVQDGDHLVLVPLHINTVASVPAGWVSKDVKSITVDGAIRVYTKTAVLADAGTMATVTFNGTHHGGAALFVVRGGAGPMAHSGYAVGAAATGTTFNASAPGTVFGDLMLYVGGARGSAGFINQIKGTTDVSTGILGSEWKGIVVGHGTATDVEGSETQTWSTDDAVGNRFGVVILMEP